jgi:DegV family protein with EDD domain
MSQGKDGSSADVPGPIAPGSLAPPRAETSPREKEERVRIGLVIDAVCDMPEPLIEEYGIEVVPVTVQVGGLTFLDTKEPRVRTAFYRDRLIENRTASTAPPSAEAIKRLFLERLVTKYDFVFFLTTASSRSAIYDNAQAASFGIISEYRNIRAEAGLTTPFVLRVIDTQVIVGAQGVAAVEAARMIRAGATPNEVELHLSRLVPRVYGYLVPNDLWHIRESSRRRGEPVIGLLQYGLARLLQIKPVLCLHQNQGTAVATIRKFENANARLFQFVGKLITQGKLLSGIGVGYTGSIAELEELPGYRELKQVAAAAGVELLTTQMGITAGIYFGSHVVGVAFAAEEHEFE